MSNLKQKSASKDFGFGSTRRPPLENVQIKAGKRCLKQFGFGLDPLPPLDNVQIKADFFPGLLPLPNQYIY